MLLHFYGTHNCFSALRCNFCIHCTSLSQLTMSFVSDKFKMSLVVRKPSFCICENKDADQLRGNREADQRLCFRHIDSTILLLPRSRISSLYPSSVTAQPSLCRTRWETRRPVFSQRGSNYSDHDHCDNIIA